MGIFLLSWEGQNRIRSDKAKQKEPILDLLILLELGWNNPLSRILVTNFGQSNSSVVFSKEDKRMSALVLPGFKIILADKYRSTLKNNK